MAGPKKKTSAKPAARKKAAPKWELVEDEEEEKESDEESADSDEPIEEVAAEALPVESPEEGLIPLTGALSASDPLRRYLQEIQRYALLEPEEEIRLVQELRQTGSLDAARRLVNANLRLVVKIAFEYRSVYTNILDLIQEGNIGLMKAVSKFDPTKGSRLGYYASWWIRSYILKFLLENFRLIKVGTTQAQKKLFYHLVREKERLEAQGIVAAPKLLADRLNVREKDVVEMQHRLSGSGAEVSIDAPVSGDEGQTGSRYGDLLPSSSAEAPDEALARDQLLRMLEGKLPAFTKTLNDRERKILEERLLSDEPKTLQEVADQYGLTRERVRQIESKILEKLKLFLSDLMGELLQTAEE